ncbi:MAG: DNA repair protein RecN, partial [Clostridia bacterium]
ASPAEIERVETRYDLLKNLSRKYGETIDEMIAFLENAKSELAAIEYSDKRELELELEIKKCSALAWECANELFDMRSAAARDFESRVLSELAQLDMAKVRFNAHVSKSEVLSTRGCDNIEFLIATNAGEPLKPLSKIASGGELARIMLALKNVLAEKDDVETLVFDEVDAGVSGRAAQKVAVKLAHLATFKQILCVTHLAQMSAMADTHFKIEKSDRDNKTYTSVTPLDVNGRIDELARIIGGQVITNITKESAKELITSAQEIKKEFLKR